jgi:tetratricopeptide (TPR) repeat protein
MNPIATTVVSVVLATAAAAAVTIAMRPADAGPDAVTLATVQHSLESLRTEHAALQQKFDALASRPAPAAASEIERTQAPALSNEQVSAAVEAYLAKRSGQPLAAGSDGASGAPTFDLDTEFKALQGTSYWQDSALWKRLFAAGKMDEAIKRFEELAKANPTDPKAQMNLANAYLSYLQMDQSKWQLSMKADQAFDRVLDLDDHHWQARFSKAVSYTFWPDFLGKKKDAIANFETLVAQQETMPPQPQEAQTYLFLGNLLEARDPAKAKEVWEKGARRHPDSKELADKLR